MPNTIKITLAESREMSLKLEELLKEETKINDRKSIINGEIKSALGRCIEEQNRVREIILTGEITESEPASQAEIFEEEEGLNLTAVLTFCSIRSGLVYSEIQLQDVFSFNIDETTKANIRAKVNRAIFEAKQEAKGFFTLSIHTTPPDSERSASSAAYSDQSSDAADLEAAVAAIAGREDLIADALKSDDVEITSAAYAAARYLPNADEKPGAGLMKGRRRRILSEPDPEPPAAEEIPEASPELDEMIIKDGAL